MGFIAHGVDAACIDPAIIEIKKCADGDGVVNGFIRVAGCMKALNIGGLNRNRIVVDLSDKAEQSFLRLSKPGTFNIGKDSTDQLFAA